MCLKIMGKPYVCRSIFIFPIKIAIWGAVLLYITVHSMFRHF